jgi:cold shock CspA family protein
MLGIVKFWNPMKGYGFIVSEGVDFFIHVTNWFDKNQPPVAGAFVVFQLGEPTPRPGTFQPEPRKKVQAVGARFALPAECHPAPVFAGAATLAMTPVMAITEAPKAVQS